ncbi:hypothetical protein CDAR_65571 [Caerostris darwini]|uniref:Uncharacterized protein n=1 Tax=Caerostris darwini TaxID=1538125 RepID=A0AAV4SFG9_9ARAC|nr:hypothetical protein CDAR_65571 [Caerostris darwini]
MATVKSATQTEKKNLYLDTSSTTESIPGEKDYDVAFTKSDQENRIILKEIAYCCKTHLSSHICSINSSNSTHQDSEEDTGHT